MNNINYKVIFKGWDEGEQDLNLSLTFKKISFKNKIKIPFRIISDLKKLSEKNPNIVVFHNIEDVITIGNELEVDDYKNYYVILYTSKIDGKKEGFLIGNEKQESALVSLGIWPFDNINVELSKDQILDTFNHLINVTNEYDTICLISS